MYFIKNLPTEQTMAQLCTYILDRVDWGDDDFLHDYPITLGAIIACERPPNNCVGSNPFTIPQFIRTEDPGDARPFEQGYMKHTRRSTFCIIHSSF